MAHFAKLDENNVVIFVTVGRDEDDEQELTERTGDVYKKTSYNTFGGVHALGGTPFRKNFAGIGYFYDEDMDAFIPPKPYSSWVLNEESCLWEPPTLKPNDDELYIWNEQYINWQKMPEYPKDGLSYEWDPEILNWKLVSSEV